MTKSQLIKDIKILNYTFKQKFNQMVQLELDIQLDIQLDIHIDIQLDIHHTFSQSGADLCKAQGKLDQPAGYFRFGLHLVRLSNRLPV